MAEKLIRLIPPKGCTGCSYGETMYVVHEAGYVDVAPEAVDGLTRVGGFTIAAVQPADVAEASSLGWPANSGLLSGSDIWDGAALASASDQSGTDDVASADVTPPVVASLGDPIE